MINKPKLSQLIPIILVIVIFNAGRYFGYSFWECAIAVIIISSFIIFYIKKLKKWKILAGSIK